MIDLRNFNEFQCPDCGKPVMVQNVSDTQARILGCSRGCRRERYDVPDGSIMFGVAGAPHFIYTPKLIPLPCVPRFTVGGWD